MRRFLSTCRTLTLITAALVILTFNNCSKISTPPVAEVRVVSDTLHGQDVLDPYRWLEDWSDPEVKLWSEQQNRYARGYLENLPGVQQLRERLTEIYQTAFPSYYGLCWRGSRLFAKKYQPPLNQPILVFMTGADDPESEKIILDLNSFDSSHRTSLDWYEPSPDGKTVAVSLSRGGSEEGDLYLFDTASGEQLDLLIPRVNGGTAGGDLAWLADGSGFYYTRYPRIGERPDSDSHFYQQVWFHKIGTSLEEDRYIIGKDFAKICEIRLDIKYPENDLLLTVQYGDGGEFAFYLVKQNGKWHQIAEYPDQIVEIRFGFKNSLLLISNRNAPRGKILQLPINKTDHRKAKLLIPESEHSIISVFGRQSYIVPMENYLYIAYQTGGPSEIKVFNYKGVPQKKPQTPPLSTIHEMIPLDEDKLLISNSSYILPKGWYRYNPHKGLMDKTTISSKTSVDYEDTEVLREYAISKDGTRVPVNIIKLKSIELDNNNPTILYGYGGYGLSQMPSFSSIRRVWIEQGGIYAIANIRGGGEFGEEWHQQGMLTKKQNVFDDFAAAMKYLIDAGYTNREKLAIRGGSNGGLLMGAMITQHPDLFQVTVSTVGIYDMIRVELSPNGTFNIPEFGTVTNPDHFEAMYAYSPYHRVLDGTAYPAILFMTGANDPRVDPMQSRKMTARLQAATSGDAPVLLRTSASTGHGGGTPLSDKIEESVDQYSFLFNHLGMEYREVME